MGDPAWLAAVRIELAADLDRPHDDIWSAQIEDIVWTVERIRDGWMVTRTEGTHFQALDADGGRVVAAMRAMDRAAEALNAAMRELIDPDPPLHPHWLLDHGGAPVCGADRAEPSSMDLTRESCPACLAVVAASFAARREVSHG